MDEIPYKHTMNSSKEEGSVQKFFQRIGLLFKKESRKSEKQLRGRINALQSDVEEVVLGLLKFKSILKKNNDSEAITLASPFIKALVKEIANLNAMTDQNQNTAFQVKFVHHYVDWLEKAKVWSQLAALPYDPKSVEEAIMTYSNLELNERISRDMHVIKEYLHNALNNIEVADQSEKALKTQLEVELAPYLKQLDTLKKLPEDLSLKTLITWREIADRSREDCFSTALYLIDNFTTNFAPEKLPESDNQQAIEFHRLLSQLEKDVATVNLTATTSQINEKGRKKILIEINKLEESAHDLNGDLKFPQEHVGRIEAILDNLETMRNHFKKHHRIIS